MRSNLLLRRKWGGGGGVGGVVEIRATDLLERAGIAANWVLMPIGRHLEIIK